MKGPGSGELKMTGDHPEGDLAIVDRVLGGDAQAFEELVRRHERRVYRITIAICGNEQDAEEALQDTFLKVYQHLSGFRRESRFSTWLSSIAINECRQRLRQRRVTESLDDAERPGPDPMPKEFQEWHANPEQLYSRREIRRIVEEAVRSLPPAYRVVFVLRDMEEMSIEESCEALGLTVAALKSRTLRARLMVREALAARFQKPLTLKYRLMKAGMMMRDAVGAYVKRDAARPEGR